VDGGIDFFVKRHGAWVFYTVVVTLAAVHNDPQTAQYRPHLDKPRTALQS
jgi:hypothetical protein